MVFGIVFFVLFFSVPIAMIWFIATRLGPALVAMTPNLADQLAGGDARLAVVDHDGRRVVGLAVPGRRRAVLTAPIGGVVVVDDLTPPGALRCRWQLDGATGRQPIGAPVDTMTRLGADETVDAIVGALADLRVDTITIDNGQLAIATDKAVFGIQHLLDTAPVFAAILELAERLAVAVDDVLRRSDDEADTVPAAPLPALEALL